MDRKSAMKFLLLTLLSLPSFGVTPLLDHTWRVAKDPNTPISMIEMGCLKSATEKENTPAEIFTCITSQRGSWTHEEIYRIFHAILIGAKLYDTFILDYCDFVSYNPSNSEGLKLIKELHSFDKYQNSGTFEYVMDRLLNDANGVSVVPFIHQPLKRPYPHLMVPVTPNPISPQN